MNPELLKFVEILVDKLKASVLVSIIIVFLMSLLYLISIYLLAPGFYKNNPFFITISIAFLFAIVSSFFNILINILLLAGNTDINIPKENSEILIFFDAYIYNTVYHGTVLWFSYYQNKLLGIVKIDFFTFMMIIAFITIFRMYKAKKAANKCANTTNSKG